MAETASRTVDLQIRDAPASVFVDATFHYVSLLKKVEAHCSLQVIYLIHLKSGTLCHQIEILSNVDHTPKVYVGLVGVSCSACPRMDFRLCNCFSCENRQSPTWAP